MATTISTRRTWCRTGPICGRCGSWGWIASSGRAPQEAWCPSTARATWWSPTSWSIAPGGASTFYDGPEVVHIAFADPYCPELRPLALESCHEAGATVHDGGATVVVQGPRFSTRAESRWFAQSGFKVINMTQLPEALLARELEICYINIAVVTDYDVGVEARSRR